MAPTPLSARARDGAGNVATSSINVTVANTGNPSLTGQWGAPFELGIVAVNMVLMHTGKVLIFSGSFATSGIERVWDPTTNAITDVPNPYYNLFCAGHAQMADGRILVAGGYDPPRSDPPRPTSSTGESDLDAGSRTWRIDAGTPA